MSTPLNTSSSLVIVSSIIKVEDAPITIFLDPLSEACIITSPLIVNVVASTAPPKRASAPESTVTVSAFLAVTPIASKVFLAVFAAVT